MTLPERTVVILQARMGSRRLARKAMELLTGRPLITHCLDRLRAADAGLVVLATTTDRQDDVLARVAEAARVRVVRGSRDDVLARFAAVPQAYPARVVVRATADNPAVDIAAVRRVQRWLDITGADYVVEDGLPYGAAVEAIRTDVLLQAHIWARDPADREHVTTWITRHTDRFRVQRLPAPRVLRRPDLRFTVDTRADLEYMRRVLAAAGGAGGVVPLQRLIDAADRSSASAEVA